MTTAGQRTKILFIVTQGGWGGAQRYVFDLTTRLQPEYETVVASGAADTQLRDKLALKGVRHIPLKNLVRPIRPFSDMRAIGEIYHLVKTERPDIVHLNSSKAGVVGSVGAKLAGAKVVFTMHGLVLTEPLPAFKRLMYTWAEKIARAYTDMTIAVSEADREAALKFGLMPKDKIITIHNGIVLSYSKYLPRDQARKKLGEKTKKNITSKKLIGTIADFYPAKGLLYLLDAIPAVMTKNPNTHFIIIGRAGPEKSAFEKRLKASSVTDDNLSLIDGMDNPPEILKAFDLYLQPSLKEGLPYSVLQGCYAGTAIVATTVGGIPEIIVHEQSGLLVPPARADLLAGAINRLLADDKMRARLGAGAVEKAKQFDIEKMLRETKKVYEQLSQEKS